MPKRLPVSLQTIFSPLRYAVAAVALAGIIAAAAAVGGRKFEPIYISFEAAEPAFGSSRDVPPELKDRRAAGIRAAWSRWVAQRDTEIRQRLRQGDEDSLVNLLMFGTSFTKQPRLTPDFIGKLEADSAGAAPDGSPNGPKRLASVLAARVSDLMRALAFPGRDERLLTMRSLVEAKGYWPSKPADHKRLRQYLIANIARMRQENAHFAAQMRSLREAPDPDRAFLERSQLFEQRGISLDTSLLPNFAIEKSLQQLREVGLLKPGSVRRVAIIGPGLDFVDKGEGYDFYPPQTVQPFAVIDSLLRLGLADAAQLRVTTLDISTRVNGHLLRARQRALQQRGYVVQLPRDPSRGWNDDAVEYWRQFGGSIGTPTPPIKPPAALRGIELRAVRIRPEIVRRVVPADLNIVLQRLELDSADQYDLMIATNIFVYYGAFEQSLALLNVSHMLRPQGFLLSNDALLEVPSSAMRRAGDTAVPYSERASDGDRIVWYQRQQ